MASSQLTALVEFWLVQEMVLILRPWPAPSVSELSYSLHPTPVLFLTPWVWDRSHSCWGWNLTSVLASGFHPLGLFLFQHPWPHSQHMMPNAQRNPWFLMSGFLVRRLGPNVVLFAGVRVWMGVVWWGQGSLKAGWVVKEVKGWWITHSREPIKLPPGSPSCPTFPVSFFPLLGADDQTLWDRVTGADRQAPAGSLRSKQLMLCLFSCRHRDCIHYLLSHFWSFQK